jgi:hypothetical protein
VAKKTEAPAAKKPAAKKPAAKNAAAKKAKWLFGSSGIHDLFYRRQHSLPFLFYASCFYRRRSR